MFWVVVTIALIGCAISIVHDAVTDWVETPGETKIETFSKV